MLPSTAVIVLFDAHRDVGVRLDPIDEVTRHVRVEVRFADDDGDVAAFVPEKDRGLTGGVATTNDDHGRGPDTRASISVAA